MKFYLTDLTVTVHLILGLGFLVPSFYLYVLIFALWAILYKFTPRARVHPKLGTKIHAVSLNFDRFLRSPTLLQTPRATTSGAPFSRSTGMAPWKWRITTMKPGGPGKQLSSDPALGLHLSRVATTSDDYLDQLTYMFDAGCPRHVCRGLRCPRHKFRGLPPSAVAAASTEA